MAYTDHRRETFAALLANPFVTDLQIWLRIDPETGKPEVTRRVTNLVAFRIVRVDKQRSKSTFFPGALAPQRRPTGYKIYTVERVDTGEQFTLPAMGAGTTVWTVHP